MRIMTMMTKMSTMRDQKPPNLILTPSAVNPIQTVMIPGKGEERRMERKLRNQRKRKQTHSSIW